MHGNGDGAGLMLCPCIVRSVNVAHAAAAAIAPKSTLSLCVSRLCGVHDSLFRHKKVALDGFIFVKCLNSAVAFLACVRRMDVVYMDGLNSCSIEGG